MTEEQRKAQAELDRRIAGLSKAVEPDRDLWPEIEARLAETERRQAHGHWWWGAVAAAVCAAALLPLLLHEGPVPEEPVPMATVPLTAPEPVTRGLDTAGQQLRLRKAAVTAVEPGPGYREARAELLGLLEQRLGGLAPEDREIVVRNIETIRSALEEIDTALQFNPDNPLLQELMLQTYQRELDVMARVNDLAVPIRKRTDL